MHSNLEPSPHQGTKPSPSATAKRSAAARGISSLVMPQREVPRVTQSRARADHATWWAQWLSCGAWRIELGKFLSKTKTVYLASSCWNWQTAKTSGFVHLIPSVSSINIAVWVSLSLSLPLSRTKMPVSSISSVKNICEKSWVTYSNDWYNWNLAIKLWQPKCSC